MGNDKHRDQIEKNCSSKGWDQGMQTDAPNDQAMNGGVSTVEQKCNAATEPQASSGS